MAEKLAIGGGTPVLNRDDYKNWPVITEDDRKFINDVLDSGIVAGATIVTYSLYTLWPDTVAKFGTHRLVYTVPLVIYGLFRYLDLVYRHEKGGRPEQILLTDTPLLVDIALYGAAILAILLNGPSV